LAEAIMSHKVARLAPGRFVVASAGSDPGDAVHPMALTVLSKRGISWQGHPKSVTDVSDQTWDLIITVCDRAKETCPTVPGQPVYAHWGMDDPADAEGEDAQERAFADTLTYVSRRIDFLLALPVETLERAALGARVQSIADEVPVPRRATIQH
jgi:arsenate reductase